MTKHNRTFEKLAFVASDGAQAQQALAQLVKTYGDVPPAEADAIIALGGDGLMLATLHQFMDKGIPIYGMHRGSLGFLMNEYADNDLHERLAGAKISRIHPLTMTAVDSSGDLHEGLAINEVSLFRQTHQAAKLKISIDSEMRMPELICDGALVATPAGSTAYNLSAQGPILPIGAPLLALTPISAFRPRRWRGALIPNQAIIRFDVLEPDKRPVAAVADNFETRNVISVYIVLARDYELLMMFDPLHSLDERILREQFLY